MRNKGARAAALLFLAILVYQVSAAEDLYLEGEDGPDSEFLEVKDEGPLSHLTRIKRDWQLSNLFGSFSLPSILTTTVAPENYEAATEDQDDTGDAADYDNHADGSGATPERIEPDPSEKTLRVSFVVMEPFRDDYSNRDSEMFQTFSHNLANAVNALFDDLPGTQKSSLVRIQSRPADSFSCKVTLDIVTNVDNTDKIDDLLRVHIRNTRALGNYALTDTDYSANVVNPGSAFEKCAADELQCTDGRCVAGRYLCDGHPDCLDGADERDCPSYGSEVGGGDYSQVIEPRRCENPMPCASSSTTICPEQRCDGKTDCPGGEDEDPRVCSVTEAPERGDQSLHTTTAYIPEETTRRPQYESPEGACPIGEYRCDESRCIALSSVCDSLPDCSDGTDEANCTSKFYLVLSMKL